MKGIAQRAARLFDESREAPRAEFGVVRRTSCARQRCCRISTFVESRFECDFFFALSALNLVLRLVHGKLLSYARDTGCLKIKKSNVFSFLRENLMPERGMVPAG